MDSKVYKWTIDTEFNFGGRTNGTLGITEGIPLILEVFKKYNVKALFFISTEILKESTLYVDLIKREGHALGSHGHFHIQYKDTWRAKEDMAISQELLSMFTGTVYNYYRSPKFRYVTDSIYSNPQGHVGLLKHMWLNQAINSNTIFYLHPFDIVEGDNPPNLFCQLWYSNPKKAFKLFQKLVKLYPGTRRLHEDMPN